MRDVGDSFDEAKDEKEWQAAMKEEMRCIQKNQTWELVELPPIQQE